MKNKTHHILVVRLSAMGDVAMTVPVLLAFHKAHPKVKITVLTKPFFASIFEHLDFVNVIYAKVKDEHKGFIGLWKLHKQCKSNGIDAVADCHNVLRSKLLRIFFGFSGIHSTFIDKGRSEKKALTRTKNKIFAPLKPTHERYADVFRTLGFPIDLKPIDRQRLSIENPELQQLVKTSQNSELSSQKLLGIAPFAAHDGKQYPLEKMTRLINKLNNSGKYQVLLFGGPADVEALNLMAANRRHITNIAGIFKFSEELKLISHLDLMVSMDSGNGHLAAMFGVSVITLWGATHPYAGFVPFNQSFNNQLFPDIEKYPLLPTSIYGNKVVPGYENVMDSISVNKVFERISATA